MFLKGTFTPSKKQGNTTGNHISSFFESVKEEPVYIRKKIELLISFFNFPGNNDLEYLLHAVVTTY